MNPARRQSLAAALAVTLLVPAALFAQQVPKRHTLAKAGTHHRVA
jgi:hypothetical protein